MEENQCGVAGPCSPSGARGTVRDAQERLLTSQGQPRTGAHSVGEGSAELHWKKIEQNHESVFKYTLR